LLIAADELPALEVVEIPSFARNWPLGWKWEWRVVQGIAMKAQVAGFKLSEF
jgi:hypothetical protein